MKKTTLAFLIVIPIALAVGAVWFLKTDDANDTTSINATSTATTTTNTVIPIAADPVQGKAKGEVKNNGAISRIKDSNYYTDDLSVWYRDFTDEMSLLSGVTREEIRTIEAEYLVSDSMVYYGAVWLTSADSKTFAVVHIPYQISTVAGIVTQDMVFGRDDTQVFYSGKLVSGLRLDGLEIERSGAILKNGDGKWYLVGTCAGTWFVPESEIVSPATYIPPC